MKIFFNLDGDGRGRECWADEIYAAWWECLDGECPCEGYQVRYGQMPPIEELREAEYVESDDTGMRPYPDGHVMGVGR